MGDALLRLTKHHGLGNDFLVALDPTGERLAGIDTAELARRACDRHRGVGADGLIVVRSAPDAASDVAMELRNADGSRAEMSGNGIRCLAQAVWDSGWVAPRLLRVHTDAGLRTVECVDATRPRYVRAAVDMGVVRVQRDAPEWVSGTIEAAALVDAGNPHLVLLDPDAERVDVALEGPRIEAAFPGGVNIEWVWPGPGPAEVTMRVWERGAGETAACGTGSCALVAAGVHWGRFGPRTVVHNPGGDVLVEVRDRAVLTGPAAHVADVELPWP